MRVKKLPREKLANTLQIKLNNSAFFLQYLALYMVTGSAIKVGST